MPKVLEIEIRAKLSGKLLSGFPLYRRMLVDEITLFDREEDSNGYLALVEIEEYDEIQAALFTTDTNATLARLAQQSDAGLTMDAEGGFLLWGQNMTQVGNQILVNMQNTLGKIFGFIAGT